MNKKLEAKGQKLWLRCLVAALCLTAQAQPPPVKFEVARFDRTHVLKAAQQYLFEAPITITASSSPRSAGGLHDFFSEGHGLYDAVHPRQKKLAAQT